MNQIYELFYSFGLSGVSVVVRRYKPHRINY